MRIQKNFENLPGAIFAACILLVISLCAGSCSDDLSENENESVLFLPKLSGYHIFQGNMEDLQPEEGFHEYNLATQLFTDYAEKQRLIKLPVGTKLIKVDDQLPNFPDNTMIVKTFYYYHDKRDTLQGKRIIETRLLVKSSGLWNVATYVWNTAQTEATLLKSGLNTTVNWIDETGERKTVAYHVPNTRECASCHELGPKIIPIGPKLRNLNFDVVRNNQNINQLSYFQSLGLLDNFDPSQIASLPQAFKDGIPISEQARAYLDINCAHCHNPAGKARDTDLHFQFQLPLNQTGILDNKDKIIEKVEEGKMPQLGTTVVHREGLQLLKTYINSL